jgi:hypothetical protein
MSRDVAVRESDIPETGASNIGVAAFVTSRRKWQSSVTAKSTATADAGATDSSCDCGARATHNAGDRAGRVPAPSRATAKSLLELALTALY